MVSAGLVAVVTGLAATSTAAIAIAAVATFAISFTASYLIAKSISVSSAVDSSSYSQLVQEDVVAQRVIYGKRQVSMVLSYLHEEDGTQADGELLYMVGMVTNHEVESISEFYLDDTLVSEIPSSILSYEHVNGTGVIPDWLLELDNYDEDMTGSTGYWMAIKIKFDSDYFTSLPTPTVVVEGRNKILDFRDGEYKYTNNAALVIADFYMNYMNIDQDRLIMTGSGSFIDAANLCDEIMDTGEARYTINGMFELDQKPSDILNEMLKSCGGTLVRQAGLIGLLPAAFYGPSNFTVDESMVSSISISPEQPTSDAVNVMTGTFVSPDDEWADQDFTPLTDDDAIARDGQEITDDITYSFVTNSMQAQRLANIELRRRTAAGFTELTMSPLGAYCRVGRVVTIDLPQVAINGSYRVTSQTENEDQTFTVSLQRDDQAIYDDSVGEPYVPAPILSTGSNTVPAPTVLTFTTDNNVGNEIQGILSWTANSSSISYFEIVVTDATTDEVVQSGETTANSFNLNAFELGSYEANVRSVNRRGATSAYATVTFSVGTPSEVESVTVNRSNWNIELIPNISGGTPQGTLFEFYYLADPESYITSQPTYDSTSQGLSELITTSSSLNKGSLTPDRWQHFWVRSINSYGVSSFVYVQTGTTRESELVTTVVERLVAIEIESQNWDDDAGTGYKLFSPDSDPYTMPDGTVLTNPDGLAVLNNAVIKGHMTAESLTFVDSDAIPAEINNVNAVATAVQDSEDYVNANFVDSVTYGTDIAAIQAQIDKSITSWFYEGVPTLTNEPAVNWTTDADKDVQLGDLYYATDTGYSYRFTYSGGVYSWVQLSDSDITLALATANAAQDTADSKRRVFYATPVPPYDEGDLWDTGDGLKRCQTASTTTYSASHWIDVADGAGTAATLSTEAYNAAKEYSDALVNLEQVRADAYADGIVTEAEQNAIDEAQRLADIAEQNAIDASVVGVNLLPYEYTVIDPDAVPVTSGVGGDQAATIEYAVDPTSPFYGSLMFDNTDADTESFTYLSSNASTYNVAIPPLTRLILSLDLYLSKAGNIQVYLRLGDGEFISVQRTISTANEWTRESFYFNISNREEVKCLVRIDNNVSGLVYYAKNLKLEQDINGPTAFSAGTYSNSITAAKEYSDALINLEQVRSDAYADGIVTEAEQNAIDEAQRLADIAEQNAKDASDPSGSAAAALSDANSYTEGRVYLDQDNLQIQGNYEEGVSGWAIDSDGTAEFNDVVIRGSGYFEGDITGSNGTFSGTVLAQNIEGNITSAKVTHIDYLEGRDDVTYTIASWNINASSTGLERVFVLPLIDATFYKGNGTARYMLYRDGVLISQVTNAETYAKNIFTQRVITLTSSSHVIKVQVRYSNSEGYIIVEDQDILAQVVTTGTDFA